MRVRDKKGTLRKIHELTCVVCGKTFYNFISFTKTCGCKECRREYEKIKRYNKSMDKRGIVGYSPKKCAICGNLFKPTTSRGKYCSAECQLVGKRARKNESEKRRYLREKKNPKYIFAKTLRKWIERCIKGKKNKKSSFFIEYSPEDFKKSIEEKFLKGMSWSNYGKWHVDHIKPLCTFQFVNSDGSVNVEEIKKANSLDNLQPLWAEDNLRKNKRWSDED